MDPVDPIEGATGLGSNQADDEAAATRERDRYRDRGPEALPAGDDMAGVLGVGEFLLAVHNVVSAAFEGQPQGSVGTATECPLVGRLLLTTWRILLVGGGTTWCVDLGEIEEAVVSGSRLLLVLPRGIGLAVDLGQPRLVRVQVAAARRDLLEDRAGNPGWQRQAAPD